jgi:hypothetical protein
VYVNETTPPVRIPKPSKADLVEGIKKKTVIDYNSTEEFTRITSNGRIIFSPKKKQHVGEFIMKAYYNFESLHFNMTMEVKIRVKVLDVLPLPPSLDTLGERVRFYITKIS